MGGGGLILHVSERILSCFLLLFHFSLLTCLSSHQLVFLLSLSSPSLFSLSPQLFAFVSSLTLLLPFAPLLQASSSVSACSRLVPLPCDKPCRTDILFYRFRLLWFRCIQSFVGSPGSPHILAAALRFLRLAPPPYNSLLTSSPLASSLAFFPFFTLVTS